MSEAVSSAPNGACLRLTVALPPSTNNAYSNARTGGRRLTPEARRYKDTVHWQALAAGAKPGNPGGPYSLALTVYFADRRRDLDNSAKLVIDSLMAAVGGDDRYIDELRMYRRIDRERPRVEVELRGASGEGTPLGSRA